MPLLPYLDDSEHFGEGVLGGGHGRQEAEEMVGRRIREHLQIVGRVLRAQARVSENRSSLSCTQDATWNPRVAGVLPSPKLGGEPAPCEVPG